MTPTQQRGDDTKVRKLSGSRSCSDACLGAVHQRNVAGPQRTCDPRPGADMMIAVVVVGSLVRLIDSGPEDYAALQPACRIARGQLPFHRRVIPPGTRIG